ncbi:MAG: PEP/pyruvate-binding domain-containing protein [Actinomycetota bacterium]
MTSRNSDCHRSSTVDGAASVVYLGGDRSPAPGMLGGKGANLAVMLRAGLPVPETAVITTSAFRRAVDQPALRTLLGQLRNDPARADISDDAIDDAFLAVGLPDALRRDALDARSSIAADLPVVVRSSATTEDLGGASFAGQYASFVGVEADDEVIDAILRVWASLWHRAPRLYRHVHGYDPSDVAMAVVLQPMIPAERAGVVFTVNPDGPADHLRIEYVDGLGEALVSGAVTPAATVVPRDDIDRLPDETRAAARLAMIAEDVFAVPQDVEWADDGERVVLVQSRAITTTSEAVDTDDGFDTEVHAQRRYTTAGIAEMLPGVFPVLTWSTAGYMVEEAFRHTMDTLDALPAELVDGGGFVVRQRGRAALDLGLLADVAESLPGGSASELEQQYFGTALDAVEVTHVPRLERIRHDVRVLASGQHARRDQAMTTVAIQTVLDTEVDPTELDDREALALRARLLDLGVRSTAAEFNVAAAAAAAFRRLGDILGQYLGDDAATSWARRATRHIGPTETMAAVASLGAEISAIGGAVTRHDAWSMARRTLIELGRQELADAIDVHRRRAGCQRVVGGATWDEQPDRYWHLVRDAPDLARDRAIDDDVADLERELVSLPGWTRRRWLTGQVVDIRRQLVRRLIQNTVDLLERREAAKSALLSLGGRIRRLDLELGERLTRRGLLLRADDVVHLQPIELADAILQGHAVGLDEVLRRRRCVERWRSDDELPLRFTGRPTARPAPVPTGDHLQGWGASPGRHSGPIRHLIEPDETLVEPGDVVVAVRTDASWSPVFLRAAAVIVEQGGPLSHAAIVARELGLPAVVNVPGVVAWLRDESGLVTVDGDHGMVYLDRAEHGGDASTADGSTSEEGG